jgi:3-hydroxyacyl-[acyl-carrier-protein] dehydratase
MEKNKLDNDKILRLLPHRYPFMLVDQITDFEREKKISGLKNVTYDEWYFQGLPAKLMVVPASVLSEAIAQLGGMLILQDQEDQHQQRLIFFSGLDKVRFRKPVRPGDSLILSAEIVRRRGRVGRLRVEGKVKDRVVFEGMMQFAVE